MRDLLSLVSDRCTVLLVIHFFTVDPATATLLHLCCFHALALLFYHEGTFITIHHCTEVFRIIMIYVYIPTPACDSQEYAVFGIVSVVSADVCQLVYFTSLSQETEANLTRPLTSPKCRTLQSKQMMLGPPCSTRTILQQQDGVYLKPRTLTLHIFM